MKARVLFPLVASWLLAAAGAWPADPGKPLPRAWNEEECKKYSNADFEHQLQQLKAERAALVAEWQTLLKRSAAPMPPSAAESQMQVQLKDLLYRLQQSRLPPVTPRELVVGQTEPVPSAPPKETVAAPPKEPKEPKEEDATAAPVDVLAQAQALFRAHQYEEALASFRLVDLKGKKAEARAPVQYLMAIGLLHLGKAEEAVPLLREVANSRGDEKLAGYAQWQLEMVRWQREAMDLLQQHRQRRQALEKKS